MNSRAKGARGERELAKFLSAHGYPSRRGQQFSGSPESPDVVVEGLPLNIHFECKRTEKEAIYEWLEQAQGDAGLAFPVVAHRQNGKQWVAVLPLKDLLTMFKRIKNDVHRRQG